MEVWRLAGDPGNSVSPGGSSFLLAGLLVSCYFDTVESSTRFTSLFFLISAFLCGFLPATDSGFEALRRYRASRSRKRAERFKSGDEAEEACGAPASQTRWGCPRLC